MNKIFKIVAIIYFIISLPLAVVFIKNEYLRFVFHEIVVEWYSKLYSIDIVFIGDSNVAAGRTFASYIDIGYFSTLNLGQNGYTLSQVSGALDNALSNTPEFIVVLVGTNDAFRIQKGYNNMDFFKAEYSNLIKKILDSNTKPIITLVPHTKNKKINKIIDDLNNQILIVIIQNNLDYIDLNKLLSFNGVSTKKYTTDGVHLSHLALELWGQEIQKIVNK